MIKILIADDHAIVRAGLKQFLADDPAMLVVREAADGDEAVRAVREEALDVVLLDISMPGKNGIDALRQIKAIKPDLPVLMLSGYADTQYALNLIKAGANGYINKESAPDEVIDAIGALLAGKRYVSPAVAQLLLDQIGKPEAGNPHEELSQREFQILCRLARGEAIGAIADTLCLSVKTVSTYRSRMLEKMGFSNNADITAYALKHGLIE
ncbi:response regulator [Chitinimonas koreensis]|uniref:response regulator n=1 Tax=Chitinimonas koreensis TaxID=356302 RepID=UPI0003F9EC6F|nr:response regulator transcription factor [Chitinimonas koreensis]QNM95634.1 response regulator transcription factor [Chitinimonas koreensis]